MRLKERAKSLVILLPAVSIAMRKRETPWFAKFMAGLTLAYALSPIDLIPDFIPVLGYLDDLIILPILVTITIKLIPADVMKDCKEETQDFWTTMKLTRWYYGIPVALIWLLLIYWLLRIIIG